MLAPERDENLPSPSCGGLDLICPDGRGTQLAIVLCIKCVLDKCQSIGSKEGLCNVSDSLMARVAVGAIYICQANIFSWLPMNVGMAGASPPAKHRGWEDAKTSNSHDNSLGKHDRNSKSKLVARGEEYKVLLLSSRGSFILSIELHDSILANRAKIGYPACSSKHGGKEVIPEHMDLLQPHD